MRGSSSRHLRLGVRARIIYTWYKTPLLLPYVELRISHLLPYVDTSEAIAKRCNRNITTAEGWSTTGIFCWIIGACYTVRLQQEPTRHVQSSLYLACNWTTILPSTTRSCYEACTCSRGYLSFSRGAAVAGECCISWLYEQCFAAVLD